MNLGDAFLMAVPPSFQSDHLFFVISDPNQHGGTFVIVNVTSDVFRAGKECVLNPGDHPWIKKQCFVAFADAMEITAVQAQMIQALMGNKISMQPCLNPPTLARIVEAAKQSTAIPVALRKYL